MSRQGRKGSSGLGKRSNLLTVKRTKTLNAYKAITSRPLTDADINRLTARAGLIAVGEKDKIYPLLRTRYIDMLHQIIEKTDAYRFYRKKKGLRSKDVIQGFKFFGIDVLSKEGE